MMCWKASLVPDTPHDEFWKFSAVIRQFIQHNSGGQTLIAHIVHRFDVGGLQNGIINLINHWPHGSYRHAIISLTVATNFAQRLQDKSVKIHCLRKRDGKDLGAYFRLWLLLRKLKPTIIHTRNIGTMDCVLIAKLAGVQYCVHGEHGWDTHDPDGTNRKYQIMRRNLGIFVAQNITVSKELSNWLIDIVRMPANKVMNIYNGVDTVAFQPRTGNHLSVLPNGFRSSNCVVVGTVTRFEPIKDPLNLVKAFILARSSLEQNRVDLRLVMIGDGSLRTDAITLLDKAGVIDYAWLPGRRDDVPKLLASFDLFVLGSKREGISNTILEAFACGLPVIATDNEGNKELISDRSVGALVPVGDSESLADKITHYAGDKQDRHRASLAARRCAEERFSITRMVKQYQDVYQSVLAGQRSI